MKALKFIQRMLKTPGRGVISGLAVLLILMVVGLQDPDSGPEIVPPKEPSGTSGVFRFSAYGKGETPQSSLRHTTVYVKGPFYTGIEDNDLRGFLDGRFKNGWNQPGQTHVRVGRREMSKIRSVQQYFLRKLTRIPGVGVVVSKFEPEYPFLGEQELFRVLYRLDRFGLPRDVKIVDSAFKLFVEKGPSFKIRLYLYEVKKDWIPGGGGTQKNNISPPEVGEVWWKDVAFGEREWGLPGAGFAADDHPEADVAAQPLAWTEYIPGDQKIEFSSEDLSRYISGRIREGKPVLFLLKLSDFREDTPESRISFYSSEHGDNRNVVRRPQLFLDWESPSETLQFEKPVKLEYGRMYYCPRLNVSGSKWFSTSFISDPGYEQPTLQFRGGVGHTDSPWKEVRFPFSADWDWLEFRIFSGKDPIIFGQPFRSQLKDTWVVTAPPTDQIVEWKFISPTGKTHKVSAEYIGEYEWEVLFKPEEIGRWKYSWTQQFTGTLYQSAEGEFDVFMEDRDGTRKYLEILKNKIIKGDLPTRQERVAVFGVPFMKIQRAFLQMETPESFRSSSGQELREKLDEVRELIWGKSIPEEIPLQAFTREW